MAEKVVCAQGKHLILDMYGASNLTNIEYATEAFRDAVQAAGATILDINMHDFKTVNMPSAGFTGVAVLAESHMSVHTWPEHGYAAFDIFMCGDADIDSAERVLMARFSPTSVERQFIERRAVSSIGLLNKEMK